MPLAGFQSSPLSQEGRYWTRLRQRLSRPTCFNPRPSRKRGATRSTTSQAQGNRVSILAPLARGALPRFLDTPLRTCWFQSSPLSQEGRYVQTIRCTESTPKFQSSPLSQEGRYGVRRRGFRSRPRVSILAPLARGALPARKGRDGFRLNRFNPRPSRKRGATRFPPNGSSCRTFQSSPLSQEGRYLHLKRRGDIRRVSILAPLARGALPSGRLLTSRCLRRFNPRPSRKRGATRRAFRFLPQSRSFNPRPSRKRGATPSLPASVQL